MAQSGLLFFNDRDVLTDFSLTITELSGWPGMIGGTKRDVALIDGPEMQGAILDPRLVRRKAAVSSVKGIVSAATPALAVAALDALRGLLGLGEIAVRTGYATDRYCLGICDTFDGVSMQGEDLNGKINVALSFSVKDGVAFRLQPDGYALITTRTAVPIGTAESKPVITVHGGGAAMTNPTITVRNAAGDIVQTMLFTASLGANDALRIDSARSTVSKIASGTVTDGLAAGYWLYGDFPILRPYDGNVELGAYPSVELSSATGAALGSITYTRRYA